MIAPRDPGPSDFYVYGYFEPGSDEPFYIGKGRKGRARSHLIAFKKSKWGGLFYIRLRELAARGITPDVRLLHEDMTESDAFDREIDLIERWGRIDIGTGCLCNHTRGGEGTAGRQLSAETRAKLGQANKGRKRSPETRARISQAKKSPSAETRAKISQANRNRSDETLAKMSRSATGKRASPETRAKLSRSATGRRVSPETRAKLSLSLAGKEKSAEHRAKLSQAFGGRPLESYSTTTGETSKLYPSLSAAAADGFIPTNIVGVCRGRRKTHAGLGWRYAV